MARRADFAIDLQPALELLLVELAERPVAGQGELARLLIELFDRGMFGRLERQRIDDRIEQRRNEAQAN